MSSSQFILYTLLINGAIGFILGLIPLLFGYFNRRLRTGVIGIIASTVGGLLLGIFLSVPAAAIFTWLAIRKTAPAAADGPAVVESNDDQ